MIKFNRKYAQNNSKKAGIKIFKIYCEIFVAYCLKKFATKISFFKVKCFFRENNIVALSSKSR
jgi:hypothetical protein